MGKLRDNYHFCRPRKLDPGQSQWWGDDFNGVRRGGKEEIKREGFPRTRPKTIKLIGALRGWVSRKPREREGAGKEGKKR